MNNLSGSGVTNSLLAVIAVLLLVIVVQNSQRPALPFGSPPMMGSAPGMDNPHASMGNPHGFADDSAPQDFDPAQMIYAALRCPNDATLTLGDQGCQGKDVAARKKAVDEAFNQGLPIPKVFDQIISKFGEKALTDQALEIRRSRRG